MGQAIDRLSAKLAARDLVRLSVIEVDDYVRVINGKPHFVSGYRRHVKKKRRRLTDPNVVRRIGTVKQRVRSRAETHEREVTTTLQSIVASVPGASLAGFPFRLKSDDSLTAKFESRYLEKGLAPEEYEPKIGDALRYTLVAPPDNLTSVAKMTLQTLSLQGNEVLSVENSWLEGNAYHGINTNLKTSDGMLWELQFHTPDSYRIKEANHLDYEIMRDPDASPVERYDAYEKMLDSWADVEPPYDVETLGKPKSFPPPALPVPLSADPLDSAVAYMAEVLAGRSTMVVTADGKEVRRGLQLLQRSHEPR